MKETTFFGLPSTVENCDDQCMMSSLETIGDTTIETVSPRISVLPNVEDTVYADYAPGVFADRYTLSPDTAFNNYYATYTPPATVTIGGFTVPVTSTWSYYSPFKHRHGVPMRLHNHKGEDLTGHTPGALPESITGTGYSVTMIER